jgi:hypothetical protein
MAVKSTKLRLDDYPEVTAELQPTLEQLFDTLNPFLKEASTSLSGALLLQDNIVSSTRTIVVRAPDRQWHEIDAEGEPEFENGWDNLDPDVYVSAAYRIDPDGRVHLRGIIEGGTDTATTVIFTLPVGYRPAQQESFAITSNSAFGDIYVSTGGAVTIAVANTAGLSLSGISFDAVDPAPPDAYVGAGWPVTLSRDFAGQIAAVWLVNAMDQATGVPNTAHLAQPAWTEDNRGNAVISRIEGLSPARTYQLTFILFAEKQGI